jgi:hypothetical protein
MLEKMNKTDLFWAGPTSQRKARAGLGERGVWRCRVWLAISFLWFAALASGCRPSDPPLDEGFEDDFERKVLGKPYFDTIGRYRIIKGRLNIEGAYNHPLWLRRRLPRNVEITFDVEAKTDDGDIKVEVFGDGRSHAMHRGAYMATGYVVCMGGWKNSKSFIARKDEHGKEGEQIVSRKDPKARVDKGRRYHWRIVRKGDTLEWYVDGELFLSYEDSRPLFGSENDHFGFNNWQSDVYFDNLKIRPL